MKDNVESESVIEDDNVDELAREANREMRQRGIEANRETLTFLREHQEEAERRTRQQILALQRSARKTFRDLRIMVWVIFTVGIVLIIIAILLFVFQGRTLEAMGLGAIGTADWIAMFLYKPMDRLQKANADFAQQVIILRSWVVCIDLELLAMDITQPSTVTQAARNIQTRSVGLVGAIERFVEGSRVTAATAQSGS